MNKGKDLDSKIQKSKKSKNYRGAPKVLDFVDLHCVFGVFWIFPKKKTQCFFLDFRGFWFWKILKLQKAHFFLIFPVFIEKSKKQHVFFLIFQLKQPKIQQQTIGFLDFQEFPKAKTLKSKKQ